MPLISRFESLSRGSSFGPNLRRFGFPALILVVAFLLAATAGAASPYGEGTEYRTLFDPDGSFHWLNPRVLIWIFAQLHLLFGAFVLAVPMFVVIIEVVGLTRKDPAEAKRYDDLAHEFCRLLATAFSVTAILGAVFTFLCMGLYPKMFGYLVDVFGPTMYLYSIIFFGESFSLYLYYYGWGKIAPWKHALLGVCLNVFGVSLMLIANAWTTFTMAPAGIDETGAVFSRYDAFFNYLLHPINIHRLIANLCMGGSVAAAYAAYKFLTARTEEQKAHYDWMGYIGNFIAILALLPLPFAGYYLGFEIYGYNQQLGIYMMGGTLSWLFIMQAVLVGALFFAANYYLWLGMDRIEGSHRYRGWIKWLLGLITLCVLVWATPKQIILTSSEISEIGGTSHPILGIFGVMSAKNGAVNLMILATFLSFILYRRGNKEAIGDKANLIKTTQAVVFGATAAWVIFVSIGGYVDSLWAESSARIAMSPWQVVAVLACMIIVMPLDIILLRGAKDVGRIRWGKVSPLSQYTLFFLAVSFTWLMALMGFVRSSLRQHWHVYEVLPDNSPWAFTPALGYATIIVTVVVMLFFFLVAMVAYLGSLGAHDKEEDVVERKPSMVSRGLGILVLAGAAVLVIFGGRKKTEEDENAAAARDALNKQSEALEQYAPADAKAGTYKVPIDRAFELMVDDPKLLDAKTPAAAAPTKEAPPGEPPKKKLTAEERGQKIFERLTKDPSLRGKLTKQEQDDLIAFITSKKKPADAKAPPP